MDPKVVSNFILAFVFVERISDRCFLTHFLCKHSIAMVCPYSGVLWALIHVAILPQFLPLWQMYARVIVGLVFEQCYHQQPLYASCPH